MGFGLLVGQNKTLMSVFFFLETFYGQKNDGKMIISCSSSVHNVENEVKNKLRVSFSVTEVNDGKKNTKIRSKC